MAPHGTQANDLLYCEFEGALLAFIARDLASEILDTRAKLAECSTWGDARRLLPAQRFDELVDDRVAPADQPPADDADLEFDVGELQWPCFTLKESAGCLPADALERFGEDYSGLMDTDVNLPAEIEDDLIEHLRACGIRCERDERIEQLVQLPE